MTRRPLRAAWALGLLSGALLFACGDHTDHYPTIDPGSNNSALPTLPMSGGTLLVMRDGVTAVAADPDLDTVFVVDTAQQTLIASIALTPGDEPGRIADDGAGRVHVLLRRAGAIATLDPKAGMVIARRPVCAAPRGIAYDDTADALQVACAGGELVTLPAAGGEETRQLKLDRDLRDVVVSGSQLFVSTLRKAEVLTLDASGKVIERRTPPIFTKPDTGETFEPNVAWRMVPAAGGVLVSHQRGTTKSIDVAPVPTTGSGGGGGGSMDHPYGEDVACSTGISHAAVTFFPSSGPPADASPPLSAAGLPVDVAYDSGSTAMAVVAGAPSDTLAGLLATATTETGKDGCTPLKREHRDGGVVAVAFTASGQIVEQTRQPAVWVDGKRVLLNQFTDREDTKIDPGFTVFHTPTAGGSLACASCHPEGREDGRVWSFNPLGPRRTQALAGDITDTAPFHWGGDINDFATLMDVVFVHRMGGDPTNEVGKSVTVSRWLSTVPAPQLSPPDDPDAVERGRALFADTTVGCTSCHSGAKHTNNKTVDVGTGEALQVPWLVGVSWRAPFMHDGCAATLHDRFEPTCGGSQHGNTAQLTPAQLDDLVAYLETL